MKVYTQQGNQSGTLAILEETREKEKMEEEGENTDKKVKKKKREAKKPAVHRSPAAAICHCHGATTHHLTV